MVGLKHMMKNSTSLFPIVFILDHTSASTTHYPILLELYPQLPFSATPFTAIGTEDYEVYSGLFGVQIIAPCARLEITEKSGLS